MARAVFTGLRVLELGSLPAASYCARVFADFGADVIKIERPNDPIAHASPKFDTHGAPRSAWHTFLNFGKRIVEEREPALADLAAQSDVIVCGDCDADLVESLAVSSRVVIDVTWFGRSGPYSGFAGTDAICRALAGNTQLIGPEEGPPLPAPDFQAAFAAGLWSYIAAASALMSHRRLDAQRIEASVHEACVTLAEYQVAEFMVSKTPHVRLGINSFAPNFPLGIYRTLDDWIGITLLTPAQWRSFCDMLGLDALSNDPRYQSARGRLAHSAHLTAAFAPKLMERSAAYWFAESLRRKIPAVIVPTLDALIASESLRERRAVVPITIGEAALSAPGSPLRLCATPPGAGGEWSATPAPAQWRHRQAKPEFGQQQACADARPLEGMRVVDFTMGWAGPLCTRTLADLGADVVKVESCSYPDWWRGVDRTPLVLQEKTYEKQGRFAAMNRNKRGITLDLTRPKGVELAKALVAMSDAVVDNYSFDVLPKFGLGPEALRALNPKLVTLSMTAFGASSPWRDCRAYGSTLEQGSGLPLLVGEAGGEPVMGHPAYGDPVGGLNGAAALLTAVLHARRTGEGQHIDLSQIECMMQMTAPWMVAYSSNRQEPARFGRGHPDHAPHGIYRCSGEDTWIAVAVRDASEWRALCQIINRADLASDDGLLLAEVRRRNAVVIDAAIEGWARTQTADAAMLALQTAGIPAGVVRRPCDVLDDPHLSARGFWQVIERDFVGRHPQPSPAIRVGGMPYRPRAPAPTLGQYNRDILIGLLGLSEDEIVQLHREKIIGTEPIL